MNRRIRVSLLGALITIAAAQRASAEAPYNIEWSRQFGTSEADVTSAVALDPLGNIFVGGHTLGSFGNANSGDLDVYLTKYGPTGGELWKRQFGTSGTEMTHAMAVNSAGEAFIAGETSGALAGANAGFQDAFVRKYDTAGNVLWTKQFGTNQFDIAWGAAVDSLGNVLLSGLTEGSLAGPNMGRSDGFLRKYDTSGNVLWTKQFGTAYFDDVRGMAVDQAGNSFVASSTPGPVGQQFPHLAEREAVLLKFDPAGNMLWSRQFGTILDYYDDATNVAVDTAGNAFVMGRTWGSLGGPNPGQPGDDVYIRKYDTDGNVLWGNQIGTSSTEIGAGLAVDSSGNAFIAGVTAGSLGGPLEGAADVFLSKFGSSGQLLWTKQFGTSVGAGSSGVAIDGPGNVFLSGTASGPFAGLPLGSDDAFLIKFAVPEPSAAMMLGAGLVSLLAVAKRRCRQGLPEDPSRTKI